MDEAQTGHRSAGSGLHFRSFEQVSCSLIGSLTIAQIACLEKARMPVDLTMSQSTNNQEREKLGFKISCESEHAYANNQHTLMV
jgi:hypothetical protein